MAKFVIYKDAGNEYRWRLVDSNGEKIASSGESFDDKTNAKQAAETVKADAGSATIVEE
jgi:uncharacterized protein YegP (UPF0339 family)